MSSLPTVITSMGMACPLGLTADASCAAIRAGLDRFQELPYKDDQGEQLKGSLLTALGATTSARRRWLPLLRYAIGDALRELRLPSDVHLMLVLPKRPERLDLFVRDLADVLGAEIPTHRSHFFVGGPCAAYEAIEAARHLLAQRQTTAVMVAAADSLISGRVLLDWSRQRRLLTRDNSDGLIPGEAAAALVLTQRAPTPLGYVLAIGFGLESGLLSNDEPLRSQGIVQAARAALADCGLDMHDIDLRLSDAAGESYSFREQALAVLRTLRTNKRSFPLARAASSLGHTGVAAGLCNLVLALNAARARRFPGRRAIAYTADDSGKRAALILEPTQMET